MVKGFSIFPFLGTFFLLLGCLYSHSQEKIRHEVHVNAQIVPVYAVDNKGNPVFNLSKEDIEVFIGNRKIPFYFFPVVFEEDKTVIKTNIKRKVLQKAAQRTIFIIIDSMFNSQLGAMRSKRLLKQVIGKGLENDRFVILENRAGGGLALILGPENDKAAILDKIEAIRFMPERYMKYLFRRKLDNESLDPLDDQIRQLKKQGDLPSVDEIVAEGEKNRYKFSIRIFGYSLAQLKYILQGIRGSKLVFFFSEGIARGAMAVNDEDNAINAHLITNYLQRISEAVNEGGAVLHAVNPRMLDSDSMLDDFSSGEMSLRVIANESGGGYFEGSSDESIITNIQRITSAYYEVSFELDAPSTESRELNIVCKREGVRLINPRLTAKIIPYPDRNEIEKKIQAHYILTSRDRSMFGRRVQPAGFRIVKARKKKETTDATIEIRLPDDMTGHRLDFFTFKQNRETQVHRIDFTQKPGRSVTQVDITSSANEEVFLVVIDPVSMTALYIASDISGKLTSTLPELPQGYDISPEIITPDETISTSIFSEKQLLYQTGVLNNELTEVLRKAAGYCEKLTESSIRFFCTEKIIETEKSEPEPEWRLHNLTVRHKTSQASFLFDYQIHKTGREIKENRVLLGPDGRRTDIVNPPLQTRFYSQYSIFAPVSLLGREEQANFHYRLIEQRQEGGRNIVVIEAVPLTESVKDRNYGKIWVDAGDGSVLHIETNPESIDQYTQLQKFARRKGAEINLMISHDYGVVREGLRYPSKTEFIEKFTLNLYPQLIKKDFEYVRTHTVFEYANYQFFKVDTRVDITK